jgi:hypothetical protein
MSAGCVTDWSWPQVQVGVSRQLLFTCGSRCGPMATFRTYAEVLGPDHPLVKNKARSAG